MGQPDLALLGLSSLGALLPADVPLAFDAL